MTQREKLELAVEALEELCEEVQQALRKAKDALHDIKFGPGPATPLIVDLGKNLEDKLSRMAKKLSRTHRRTIR